MEEGDFFAFKCVGKDGKCGYLMFCVVDKEPVVVCCGNCWTRAEIRRKMED